MNVLTDNPAARIPNPEAKRDEVQPFTSWGELELISGEFDPRVREPADRRDSHRATT
ncbi:MAG: hypothetical protein ACE5EV_02875 [Gaiellales bacterium]